MTCANRINSEMTAVSSETLLLTVGPRPADLTQPFPMVVARPHELGKGLSCGSEAPCGALPALAHPLAWSALPKAPKSPQSNGQTLTMQFAHGVVEIHDA